MESETPKLQVLICTYGAEGLNRIARGNHPAADGVEYLVSWQTGDAGESEIPVSLRRPDMKIYPSSTKGLSVNRNLAIEKSTAPLLLIGDDDVSYSREGLETVIEAFGSHPDCDLLTFRYRSDSHPRFYPDEECSIFIPHKRYFVCSIEIAFRSSSIKDRIRFNENFGIGATFPAGEEDIFLNDCKRMGLKGVHIPVEIERHEGPTTSDRYLMSVSRPMTKGAVLLRLYPMTWTARMIVHAMREIKPWRKGLVPSPWSFVKNWLRGVRTATRLKVFKNPKDHKDLK